MYAISTTLGLAASVALLRAERTGRTKPWDRLRVVVHGQTHTRTTTHCFILVAQGLYWLVLWRRHRELWRQWVVSQIAIILLYLPWLIVGWRVLTAYHGNGDSPALPDMLYRVFSAFSLGQTISPALLPLVLPLVVVVFVLGWITLVRWRVSSAAYLALYLFVPVAAVYVSSISRPVFNEQLPDRCHAAVRDRYRSGSLRFAALAWAPHTARLESFGSGDPLRQSLVHTRLLLRLGVHEKPRLEGTGHASASGNRTERLDRTKLSRPNDVVLLSGNDPAHCDPLPRDRWMQRRSSPASRMWDRGTTAFGSFPTSRQDWDAEGFVATWLRPSLGAHQRGRSRLVRSTIVQAPREWLLRTAFRRTPAGKMKSGWSAYRGRTGGCGRAHYLPRGSGQPDPILAGPAEAGHRLHGFHPSARSRRRDRCTAR